MEEFLLRFSGACDIGHAVPFLSSVLEAMEYSPEQLKLASMEEVRVISKAVANIIDSEEEEIVGFINSLQLKAIEEDARIIQESIKAKSRQEHIDRKVQSLHGDIERIRQTRRQGLACQLARWGWSHPPPLLTGLLSSNQPGEA